MVCLSLLNVFIFHATHCVFMFLCVFCFSDFCLQDFNANTDNKEWKFKFLSSTKDTKSCLPIPGTIVCPGYICSHILLFLNLVLRNRSRRWAFYHNKCPLHACYFSVCWLGKLLFYLNSCFIDLKIRPSKHLFERYLSDKQICECWNQPQK